MADFVKQIEALNLQHFADAINDEEVGGSEFRRNAITFFEGAFTNMATMTELPAGQRPTKEVQALPFSAAAPDGAALVWSGAAIIGGTNTAISIYR